MEIFIEPESHLWGELARRPQIDIDVLRNRVAQILNAVKRDGDAALRRFNLEFDGHTIENLLVSESEFSEAESLNSRLKSALQVAKTNIEAFHKSQPEVELVVETMPGVVCSRRSLPIEKVGLYIPGGTAPLFSTVLMLAIPARIAGCKEVVICTPPGRDGTVNKAILYAAKLCGVNKIYKTGGAQAIAAMAFGTQTIPGVHKIFGPGNQYVTCAKQMVNQAGVAIDMPAGPSEVAVYADETCVPEFVASDLLSQAEHGADSQVVLVASSRKIAREVETALKRQVESLPRMDLIGRSLENSKIIILENATDAFRFLNEYAPEHLIIASDNASELAGKVVNAGSVFLGHFSAESIGDYASGTNHTLPTNGYAKAYSGVSVDSFVKKITFQQVSETGLKNIGETVEILANAEGLAAHANAVTIRLNRNDR